MDFSSLNKKNDIIICAFSFELVSHVSNVAHGPLVSLLNNPLNPRMLCVRFG